jgi:hypothetical protein
MVHGQHVHLLHHYCYFFLALIGTESTSVVPTTLDCVWCVGQETQDPWLIIIKIDPPAIGIGIPCVPGRYSPFVDQTIPPDDRMIGFARWVTRYFKHGELSTQNGANIEYVAPDLARKSDISSLPPDEFHSLLDLGPSWRSDLPLVTLDAPILFKKTFNALFDPSTRSLWPNLKVWLLYCDSSAGVTVHAALELQKLAKENNEQPIHVQGMEDAHHAVGAFLSGTNDSTYPSLRAGVLG